LTISNNQRNEFDEAKVTVHHFTISKIKEAYEKVIKIKERKRRKVITLSVPCGTAPSNSYNCIGTDKHRGHCIL